MSAVPLTPTAAAPPRARPKLAVEEAEKGPNKLLIASIAFHWVAGPALGAAEVKKIHAATVIEIADLPKPAKAEPPREPPPPPKQPPRRAPPRPAAPAPAATPAPAAEPARASSAL